MIKYLIYANEHSDVEMKAAVMMLILFSSGRNMNLSRSFKGMVSLEFRICTSLNSVFKYTTGVSFVFVVNIHFD